MSVLQHIANLLTRGPADASPYTTRNRCPHCNEHTTWQVAPLRRRTRCRQCNHNPLRLNDA